MWSRLFIFWYSFATRWKLKKLGSRMFYVHLSSLYRKLLVEVGATIRIFISVCKEDF